MVGFVCQGPHTVRRELGIISNPRPKPGVNPELGGRRWEGRAVHIGHTHTSCT